MTETYSDDLIRSVLTSVKTIAVVGASDNPARPSNGVFKFLLAHGYRAIPINPGLAGRAIGGVAAFARLADVGEPIDMVDIFRNSEAAGAAVDEALQLDPQPKVVWMQLGVVNEAAARNARARGLTVVMDRCPKIEYARLID